MRMTFHSWKMAHTCPLTQGDDRVPVNNYDGSCPKLSG
jgi:hypothetical protein